MAPNYTKTRQERLEATLKEHFAPDFLHLADESFQHASHRPGQETHYKLLMVSDFFTEMSEVKRASAVYKVLDDEFKSGLHALSMALYTKKEAKDTGLNASGLRENDRTKATDQD